MLSILSDNLIYIIQNYFKYRDGFIDLSIMEQKFEKVVDRLNIFPDKYIVEYNHIEGKPNIPFIPLFPIRDPLIASHMTEGIYVVLLVKNNEGIYISLNQGTENKKKAEILDNTKRFRRKVNDILATYKIEHILKLVEDIDITSTIPKGRNIKRARSYEQANIKAIFYDINSLKENPEKFIRDILWFMELYRKLF